MIALYIWKRELKLKSKCYDCSLYMEEGVELKVNVMIALYIWKRELKLKSKCYDCSLYMEEGVEVEQ